MATNVTLNPGISYPTTLYTLDHQPHVESREGATLQNPLKGRVSNPCLRMIPSLLALIACVTGIVCALVWWHSPYLLFAFVPGTLGSLYTIGKGWCNRGLRTLTENNETLQRSLGVLRGRITELEGEINRLESNNLYLRQTLNGYIAVYAEIQQEVNALKNIERNLGSHDQNLGDKVQKLEEVKANLQTSLEGFQSTQPQLERNVSNLERHVSKEQRMQQQMKAEVDRLIQFSTVFRATLEDPKNFKIYKEFEALHMKLEERQAELATVSVLIEERTNQLEERTYQLEERTYQLKELEKAFQNDLEKLQHCLREAGQNNETLKTLIPEIMKIFKGVHGA